MPFQRRSLYQHTYLPAHGCAHEDICDGFSPLASTYETLSVFLIHCYGNSMLENFCKRPRLHAIGALKTIGLTALFLRGFHANLRDTCNGMICESTAVLTLKPENFNTSIIYSYYLHTTRSSSLCFFAANIIIKSLLLYSYSPVGTAIALQMV